MSDLQDTLMRFVEVIEANRSQAEQGRQSIDALTRRVEFMDAHLVEIKHTLAAMAKAEESRQNLWVSVVKSPFFNAIVTAIIVGLLSALGVHYTTVANVLPAVVNEGQK